MYGSVVSDKIKVSMNFHRVFSATVYMFCFYLYEVVRTTRFQILVEHFMHLQSKYSSVYTFFRLRKKI